MRERKEENGRGGKPRRGRWSQAEVARLKELYGLRDDASIARELNRPLASVRKMAEKIFPSEERAGPWLEEEIERLKEYLGASKPDVIARILGRKLSDVNEEIAKLGSVQRDDPWTRDEIARFKRIYGTRTDEDLAAVFGRSVLAIQVLAEKHALAKDKAFIRKLEGEAATRMPRWSAEEVELLRELYPDVANLDIAQRLSRTVKSVVSKAHNLGLKKSNERLQRMGRENVSLRYQEGALVESSAEPVVELEVTPRPEPDPQPQDDVQVQETGGYEKDVEIPRPQQPRVDASAMDVNDIEARRRDDESEPDRRT